MIMAKLKEATREQHEGTEGTVDIMGDMVSLDSYKTLLCKFYRFYSAVESQLQKLNLKEFGYDFAERAKTPKLEKDLASLGLLQAAKEFPAFGGLPSVDSVAKAFGCLYVLEGATLGGQIINRHLKQQLDLNTENGGSFFNGYGEKTGLMWKEFCQLTTDFAETAKADDSIIQTAKETFDSFGKCYLESIPLEKKVANLS